MCPRTVAGTVAPASRATQSVTHSLTLGMATWLVLLEQHRSQCHQQELRVAESVGHDLGLARATDRVRGPLQLEDG